MKIANQNGKPDPQDVHLIPAIIRMFPTIRQDVASDGESPIELAATIGRSGINPQQLPLWWPALLKNATDIALNRAVNNADQPVDHNNVPIFHHDDLGRFMPTTRKARDLSRAQYLNNLCARHNIDVDPALAKKLLHNIHADADADAWITHSISRFPQQLVPDDCNYVAATRATIAPTKG